MLELITADQNLPFAVALVVMLAIALLEGVALLLGAGLSNLLESLLPDLDLDVDGPDVQGPGLMSQFLGWLYFGKIPFLVVLILLLTFFGICGLLIQSFLNELVGRMLPGGLAAVPALLIALPLVRWSANGIARVLPQETTEAVSSDSFIGRVAVITLGTARVGSPAQARLKDRFGQTHYVMVEPADAETEFPTGSHALLMRRKGSLFVAVPNPYTELEE